MNCYNALCNLLDKKTIAFYFFTTAAMPLNKEHDILAPEVYYADTSLSRLHIFAGCECTFNGYIWGMRDQRVYIKENAG